MTQVPESFADLPPDFVDEDPGIRPVIQITTEIHNVISEACQALSNDRNVFCRGPILVDVVRATEADADSFVPIGGPRIRTIPSATMRERLTRCAMFQVFDGRRKKDPWKPAIPSDHVVHGVVSRGEYPMIRPILGVLEAPSMRPDGTIIQKRGYDHRTGYLYEPSTDFPEVPENPTQAEATKALAEVFEAFADFPFAIEAGRSAAVAGLLSIIARPAITGAVPAFIVDASTRGTGKSLTADVIGTIATGRATSKMSWPADDVELEKVLGAYAMQGANIVNFDNVVRRFGGGPLDRCLTATDTVELRVLGKTDVPAVLWRAVVLATGNNIDLSGDTSRRVLMIRLESPLEHPEDRCDFKHPDLLRWCVENRGRLVVAALTVLRAWFVAGKPKASTKRWGSFEAWSDLVPAAIVHAGGADPMGARPAMTEQEEPEKVALLGLLDHLPRFCNGSGGVTARDLQQALYPAGGRRRDEPPDGWDNLREAIEGLCWVKSGQTPTSKAIGNGFKRYRRRVVAGKRLDSRSIQGGIYVWYVSNPQGIPVVKNTQDCGSIDENTQNDAQ
jgi:hypothetical protein